VAACDPSELAEDSLDDGEEDEDALPAADSPVEDPSPPPAAALVDSPDGA
jgi:hypothetical protein